MNEIEELECKMAQLNPFSVRDLLLEAANTNSTFNLNLNSIPKQYLIEALFVAVPLGSFECAKWLIDNGADPNLLDGDLVCQAFEFKDRRMFELLVPHLNLYYKGNLLEMAVRENWTSLAIQMLNWGAEDYSGRALLQAAYLGNIIIVKKLIHDLTEDEDPLALKTPYYCTQNKFDSMKAYLEKVLKQATIGRYECRRSFNSRHSEVIECVNQYLGYF